MLGDILLKMVGVLTTDDVRQLKAAGGSELVKSVLRTWGLMAIYWRQAGVSDSKVWADVKIKLNELRSALEEE